MSECRVLRGVRKEEMSDQVRLVLRILLKTQNEGGDVREGDGEVARGWDDLMDNADGLLKDSQKLLNELHNQLRILLEKSEENVKVPDIEIFASIYGKILTNSFSLRTDR